MSAQVKWREYGIFRFVRGGPPERFFEIKNFLEMILISEFLRKHFYCYPDFLMASREISAPQEISGAEISKCFFSKKLLFFKKKPIFFFFFTPPPPPIHILKIVILRDSHLAAPQVTSGIFFCLFFSKIWKYFVYFYCWC